MFARVARVLLVAVAVTGFVAPVQPASAQADQEALLSRVRELASATDGEHFVTPMPGSRSQVIAVDVSSSLYFFLERGSIRGSEINEFYAAYESGDMDAAYSAFLGSAIMMVRATDYGWNGLGNPMVTEAGAEIGDILFKDVGGVFSRAPEITEEDIEDYVALLETVVAALEEDG